MCLRIEQQRAHQIGLRRCDGILGPRYRQTRSRDGRFLLVEVGSRSGTRRNIVLDLFAQMRFVGELLAKHAKLLLVAHERDEARSHCKNSGLCGLVEAPITRCARVASRTQSEKVSKAIEYGEAGGGTQSQGVRGVVNHAACNLIVVWAVVARTGGTRLKCREEGFPGLLNTDIAESGIDLRKAQVDVWIQRDSECVVQGDDLRGSAAVPVATRTAPTRHCCNRERIQSALNATSGSTLLHAVQG